MPMFFGFPSALRMSAATPVTPHRDDDQQLRQNTYFLFKYRTSIEFQYELSP
jgi:hypothetical protein